MTQIESSQIIGQRGRVDLEGIPTQVIVLGVRIWDDLVEYRISPLKSAWSRWFAADRVTLESE